MGAGTSKSAALTAADHKGIPLLAALDDSLVAVLRSGAIKLLRAEFPARRRLRSDGRCCPSSSAGKSSGADGEGAGHPHLPHAGGGCFCLEVSALRSLSREVAGLTSDLRLGLAACARGKRFFR